MKQFKSFLKESKLSRILQHVQSDTPFAVISTFRKKYSDEENIQRHKQLLKDIKTLGYGFIQLKGGYTGDEGYVEELSVFIPNITEKHAFDLGKKYEQESIILKTEKKFGLFDATTKKKMAGFKKDRLVLDTEATKDFFSKLLKGTHRKKKFLFNLKEKVESNFNRVAYLKESDEWITLYEERVELRQADFGKSCGNCKSFDNQHNHCDKHNIQVNSNQVCDDWTPTYKES